MRAILIIFFFYPSIFISQNEVIAYNPRCQNLWNDLTYDMGNVFLGVGHTYTRPFEWNKSEFISAGAVTLGTLGLYAIDDDIRGFAQNHKDDVPEILSDYGWYAGSPQSNYGFTGAVYLTGLFTKNEKLRRTGVLLIWSATATGFLQQLTKSGVGRARPGSDLGKNHFRLLGKRNLSFFPIESRCLDLYQCSRHCQAI